MGVVVGPKAMASTLATTWLVMTTATPNSSAMRCRRRRKSASFCCRAASSPRPEKSVRKSAVALSTTMSAYFTSAIMAQACSSSAIWCSLLKALAYTTFSSASSGFMP